jgi:hypothetical protein
LQNSGNATTGSLPGRSLGTKQAKFSLEENTLLGKARPASLTRDLLRLEQSYKLKNKSFFKEKLQLFSVYSNKFSAGLQILICGISYPPEIHLKTKNLSGKRLHPMMTITSAWKMGSNSSLLKASQRGHLKRRRRSMNQIFLTIGALVLLSTVILSMNKTFIQTEQDTMKSEIGITAVSLATSVIEEASGMAFDKATDTTSIASTTLLTPVASLGKEAGETYATFNDFDDFNNYDTTFALNRSGTFRVRATVVYVSAANPALASATPTWNKKMTVTVSSPTMTDTLKMDYVYSYFYFR